ncbi:MAG: hypothetical protein A2044_04500 [Candidatus Firestonebacteria bacterium GWA2_43_8]|nr:MAG: hypothetical protein A2044_04500 [Candidatus Firestonebacteria bacterium GWA2_43_8]
MDRIDVVIVGAGVVGLAIAERIARSNLSVYVLEKHNSYGQETSSRNSEVIHAGMHYPAGSLKAKLCVEGNELLYDFCKNNSVAFNRTGKFIIAKTDKDEKTLVDILKRGEENGIKDMKIMSKNEIRTIEPGINVNAALYAPSSGIVDSHILMKTLIKLLKSKSGDVVYNSEVTGVEKMEGGYGVTINGGSKDEFKVLTRILINSAGLNSDVIAEKAGIDIKKENYELKYCKGQYFRITDPAKCKVKHLIYSVPDEEGHLGIHVVLDLAGKIRLGPDSQYIDRAKIDYNVNIADRKYFMDSVASLFSLSEDDLAPDTAGVRPKLQGKGEKFRDFIIKNEKESGFPGLINLIGIDSPGLTASLAIGRYVETLTGGLL